MDHPLRDDPLDFGLEVAAPSTKTRWHGSTVAVRARLVPRYVWSTASIDVFLDGRCVLRTGGQMKVTGSSSSVFYHDGEEHTAELSWGLAIHTTFPFELRIDGAKVMVSDVPVENAPLLVVPALVLLSPILVPLLLSLS
jgi:hypothetical protein